MTRLVPVLFIAGALLLFLFDAWYTRAVGVLALFAFIVAGVFAIADPALLDDEDS
ncbi:MAG: hypothetical protein ACRDPC_19035 [Solirubrobacteraceae bacterium]